MPTIPPFKNMPLWQRSVRLATDVLRIASEFPPEIQRTIGSELGQTAVGIPAGIASGSKAGKQGFLAALLHARSAAAELETMLYVIQQAYPSVSLGDTIAEASDLQTALMAGGRRLSSGQPVQSPQPKSKKIL